MLCCIGHRLQNKKTTTNAKSNNKTNIAPEISVETLLTEETILEAGIQSENTLQEQVTDEGKDNETDKKSQLIVSKEQTQTKEKPKPEPQKKPTESNPKENKSSESVDLTSVSITPQKLNATADDSKRIADKILKRLNRYRTVPAQRLEGLTKYAEYRSRQLISNFAHSTTDERVAATTF